MLPIPAPVLAHPARSRAGHRIGRRCLSCDRAWGHRHHWHAPAPPFRMTSFEVCDANMESGAPEDHYNPAHINWRMESNGYEGAFSWLPSTWQRQRFPGYPSRAVDATPEQQTLVFRRYKNVGEWPTMAKC